MAYDALTTSGINNLINTYKTNEQSKRITPLTIRKSYYENLNSAYSTLSSKLDSLKSILSELKNASSTSIFYSKAAVSSNTNFLNVIATSGAIDGTHSIRINQIAKNDTVLSIDLNSSAASTIITEPGTHEFIIKAGDGSGGEFISKVSVTFESSDFTNGQISNSTLMQKVQNAINTDQAIITSSSVTGSTTSSGSFVIDLNGTETVINYSAGTYSDVIDSIVSQVNSINGLTAEKIINGSNYQLKITVNDSSKYITIKNDTGTLLSELGINVTKEKGASGLVSASIFSPVTGYSQLSIKSKNSGYDYRITEISETGSNTALSAIGLNLGTTRQAFVQNSGNDTPGFIYTTDQLNAKLTFNGVDVERNSNTISDLIDGTTITLKSVMQSSDADVEISINNDVTKIKDKINDFITKFNDVYKYIKDKSKTVDSSRGLFVGDITASSLLSTLSNIAYSSVTGIPDNEINTLSKIGITFNVDSGLILSDSDRLEDVINNNLNELINLFTLDTNGIAVNLYDRINPYLGADGYIAKSKSSFDTTISSLSDSITAAQKSIDKNAEIMRSKYQKMQMQLAQLLSYQNYFSLFGTSSYTSLTG
ncbi:MAG: flagellar filament capping protein FliD [Melioribacter sp.]|uniref:flagellar filament capping protein FliD n=1 Tax=Rosettibacter primus TaxID=3111523 RepID=UPI00247BC470|nr:flagellar filament capping protein FliD [Melioribacter sp.]